MKRIIPFGILAIVSILSLFTTESVTEHSNNSFDSGDTSWLLIATALVLLMTPGLAFFYGGMVRKKNMISTMLQSFICMCLVTVIWIVFGFSLAFGKDYGGIIGDPSTYYMMKGTLGDHVWPTFPTVPMILFAIFQLKFAVITPALITGAFAERIKFNSYLIFITLFVIFIYTPLAHATWHPEGILAKAGVLDFAGGTVVHMSAGWAALASALYLGKRKKPEHTPSRITYIILGTSLLWFGWFGFNAGSAGGANMLAASALATTTTASAAAAIAWIFLDLLKGKKVSATGTCIGTVVGLVAITPAAGYVTIPHSLTIGVVAAIVSNFAVAYCAKKGLDDTLDVFPCHGVGGMVGMLLTAVFANKAVNPDISAQGLFFGETSLFINHVIALVAVSFFTFFGALILLKVTDLIAKLRVDEAGETIGLDLSQHNEAL